MNFAYCVASPYDGDRDEGDDLEGMGCECCGRLEKLTPCVVRDYSDGICPAELLLCPTCLERAKGQLS